MTSMEIARQYLLEYLEEEFRAAPEVRIRILPFTREEEDGVTVRTESREYFFPTAWAMERGEMKQVEREVRRIKDVLEKSL